MQGKGSHGPRSANTVLFQDTVSWRGGACGQCNLPTHLWLTDTLHKQCNSLWAAERKLHKSGNLANLMGYQPLLSSSPSLTCSIKSPYNSNELRAPRTSGNNSPPLNHYSTSRTSSHPNVSIDNIGKLFTEKATIMRPTVSSLIHPMTTTSRWWKAHGQASF